MGGGKLKKKIINLQQENKALEPEAMIQTQIEAGTLNDEHQLVTEVKTVIILRLLEQDYESTLFAISVCTG
jgi:hypothetical protein